MELILLSNKHDSEIPKISRFSVSDLDNVFSLFFMILIVTFDFKLPPVPILDIFRLVLKIRQLLLTKKFSPNILTMLTEFSTILLVPGF